MTIKSLISVFMTLILLTNCTVGPNYKRPETPTPKQYINIKLKNKNPKTVSTNVQFGEAQTFYINKKLPAEWWKLFHSKELEDLIHTAFKHNPTIGAAKASLRNAFEQAYAQRGDFLPYTGFSWTPTMQQTSGVLQSNLANNNYVYSLYTGQLFITYNLNAFGNLTRQQESLMGEVEKKHFELEAAYLTISSNLVNAVIQVAALRAQYSYIKKLVKAQSDIVYIFKKRYELGDIPQSDLLVQESALAETQSDLPILKKQIQLQRHVIQSLIGRYPTDLRTYAFQFKNFQLPQEIPINLPSTLLEHRPDIRASEAQMKAANAMIGVAISNRLPMITIGSANLGTAALQLSDFFNNNTNFWGLAGIVSQPIFAGGKLMHNQYAAEATYRQSEALYKATVINAFKEVADSLRSIQQDAIAINIARKAERTAYRSLEISRLQLKLGDNSTLLILANLELWHKAKISLIIEQSRRLSDTVALFQALGGGWWNKPEYQCKTKEPCTTAETKK
jgi:NodT family efflux transporter outer membrane factor (OMF) lipoprotein